MGAKPEKSKSKSRLACMVGSTAGTAPRGRPCARGGRGRQAKAPGPGPGRVGCVALNCTVMCVAHVRMSPFLNCQVACLLKAKLCAQPFPASSLCQSPPIPPHAGPAFSHVLAWTAGCARLPLRTLRRPQQSRQVRQPSAAVAKKTTKAREARAVSVTRER